MRLPHPLPRPDRSRLEEAAWDGELYVLTFRKLNQDNDPPANREGQDPDQAISHIESMEQVVSDSVARQRLESLLLAIFAVLALVLAAVGLYSVLAYSVALRAREIGVRMALGASPLQLVRGVVRDGLGLILPGIAAGLAASLVLSRLLGSLLYGVTPIDPLTYAAVSLLLLAVGILASWLPARRAAAVDPVGSLRAE
jgi:putative ABC transport system permease protein